jgi:D-2-hydroxyglutarate dehydrogenase
MVPLDLGAKGTCQIGGNLSTNAGGVYYHRYGSLHANVLGVEVVLPGDGGRVLNLGYHPTSHRKDNTGYDLKHLFIGGEGTLGVITKVAILCPPLPSSVGAVLLTCRTLDDVVRVLHLARTEHLNEILAAFEFMDGPILGLVGTTHRHAVTLPPLVGEAASSGHYTVLVESHGSNPQHDEEKLLGFLEAVTGGGLVVDGILAQNLSQIGEFWKIREACNPAAAATGYVYKYDVSLAASDFDGFIREMNTQLGIYGGNHLSVNWGHIIGTG